MWWGLLGVTAAGVALSGCGSGDDSNISLRIANATLTHPSIDLYVNGGAAVKGTALDAVSNYATPGSGANTLQVNDSASGAALSVSAPNLSGNDHYTLVAYESGGAVKTVVVPEDLPAPVSGAAQVRLYDAAPDAGKLDVYITGPTDALTNQSPAWSFTTGVVPSASIPLTYPVGSYRVRVTASGSKTDVRLDMSAVALANQQVATLIISPTSGGTLVNGSVLLEQSTYTAQRNTNARVRLAAAVSGGATVAASATAPAGAPATSVACTGPANSCVIDGGSVAPQFGFYTVVPANSALNVTVNGASVAAPATALAAGADTTLFVYGDPGTATASLLTDDSHLPTDTSTVKLSLLNGVTGAAGSLTLTANSALVASNIAPGTVSTSTPVAGSANAMNLRVTASNKAGVFISDSINYTLNPGAVYTVMVGGDASTPQLLLH
jgi:hypothetical protein